MLELRSVSKSYPGAGQVLREVSLRVEPGQALCLAGGNAEGKTTLLEIAAGLRRPDSGEVLRPTETALVPQRPAILGELTAAAKEYVVAQGYDPVYGARPLKRFIQSKVETLIARLIIRAELAPRTTIVVDYDGHQLTAEPKGELQAL